jgi:hypothetical protein
MGDDPNTGNVSKWQAAGAAPRAIGSMDGNPDILSVPAGSVVTVIDPVRKSAAKSAGH